MNAKRVRALARNLLHIQQQQQRQAAWHRSRESGKASRVAYTNALQASGAAGGDYRGWTNTVYKGLFGKDAEQMRETWEAQHSPASIARNHIPKQEGLKLVESVEQRVARAGSTDLATAHTAAISQVRQERLLKRMIAAHKKPSLLR